MGLGMGVGESTPGSWSTVATPGTALGTPMVPMERSDISDIEKTVGAVFGWEEPSSSAPMAGEWSGSDRSERAATSVSGSGRSSLRSTKGWVSDAAPVYAVEEFYPQDPTISNPSLDLKAYSTHNHGDEKKAEYATLTMDTGPVDEAKIARSTPADYGIDTANVSGRRYEHQGNVSGSSTTRTDVPGRAQTSSPMDHQPETHVSLSESSTHPSTRFRSGSNAGSFTRRSPDYTPHQPLPPIPPPFLHPAPPITYAASAPRAPPGSLGLRSEIELTPNLVAKAQKHCRFAISALDYEDAEQAKKELRAALAVLGG
jgi:vacuolar protein sorting-associated protein VTA1